MRNGTPSLSCVLAENWDAIHTKARDASESIDRMVEGMGEIADKLKELNAQLDHLNRHIVGAAVDGPKKLERVLVVHVSLTVLMMILGGALIVVDRVKHTDTSVGVSSTGFTVGHDKKP